MLQLREFELYSLKSGFIHEGETNMVEAFRFFDQTLNDLALCLFCLEVDFF